jgi:hypothetical protein
MAKLFKGGVSPDMAFAVSNWKERIEGKSALDPKVPGFVGKMSKQQKRDKKTRDAAKTPMHEDTRYTV